MTNAKIFAGMHGIGLSNVLFARGGITIVGIFSNDYFRTDCYCKITVMLKRNYYYLLVSKSAQLGDVTLNEQDIMQITKF
jgi:capsular polysaccharide biosynthesis protein